MKKLNEGTLNEHPVTEWLKEIGHESKIQKQLVAEAEKEERIFNFSIK